MDKGSYIIKLGKHSFPSRASFLQYRSLKIKLHDPFYFVCFYFSELSFVPLFHTVNCSTLVDICIVKLYPGWSHDVLQPFRICTILGL